MSKLTMERSTWTQKNTRFAQAWARKNIIKHFSLFCVHCGACFSHYNTTKIINKSIFTQERAYDPSCQILFLHRKEWNGSGEFRQQWRLGVIPTFRLLWALGESISSGGYAQNVLSSDKLMKSKTILICGLIVTINLSESSLTISIIHVAEILEPFSLRQITYTALNDLLEH